MKRNLVSIIKIIGNLLVLIAIFFLAKRFLSIDFDYSVLTNTKILFAFFFAIIMQISYILFGAYPWLVFTESLCGKKIPFRKAMPIFAKSNFYKYVPGNVFRYVGRNQLAENEKIGHLDVAMATILDIAFCVISAGIVSTLLLGNSIIALIERYRTNFTIAFIACVIVAVILAAGIVKYRKKINITKYVEAYKKSDKTKLCKGIAYYFVQNFANVATNFIILAVILGLADISVSHSELITLSGAFLFAWIIGFVTPGAPAGIGIRESVMLFMCQGNPWQDQILLFVLLQRIASIFADISAFLIGILYEKKSGH